MKPSTSVVGVREGAWASVWVRVLQRQLLATYLTAVPHTIVVRATAELMRGIGVCTPQHSSAATGHQQHL
jgi:hypothetical protein